MESETYPIHGSYVQAVVTAVNQVTNLAKVHHVRHPSQGSLAVSAAVRWLSLSLEHAAWRVALDEAGPGNGVGEACESAKRAANDPYRERACRVELMKATGTFVLGKQDRDRIPAAYAAARDLTMAAVKSAVRVAALATIRVYAAVLSDLDKECFDKGDPFVSERGSQAAAVHMFLVHELTIDAIGAGVVSIFKEDFERWGSVGEDPTFDPLRAVIDSAVEGMNRDYSQQKQQPRVHLGVTPGVVDLSTH